MLLIWVLLKRISIYLKEIKYFFISLINNKINIIYIYYNMPKVRTQKKRRGGNNKGSPSVLRRKSSYQIGGNIDKISNKMEIMLIHDKLDFLPTSKIMNNNVSHYLQMIDYPRLQKIIDENPKYKKSPTMQQIFNYRSYQIEELDNIVFNYRNINCDDLIEKRQLNHYVKLLFLYLLECNKVSDLVLTGGEAQEQVPSNIVIQPKPSLEKVKNDLEDSIVENRVPESSSEEEEEAPSSEEEEEAPSSEEESSEEEEVVEKPIGFEEYEEKRDALEQVKLYNSGIVYYNLDWFDVCIGKTKLDMDYENQVNTEIKELGITINESHLFEKLDGLLENEEYRSKLKSALKSRILCCSNKPLSFFDRITNNISYPSLIDCDRRTKEKSLLYLHDEYKPLLYDTIDTMDKLDMTILMIYCETRQLLLSKYISLEVVRRKKDNTSEVEDILKKIYNLDKDKISENDTLLNIRLSKEEEYRKKLINAMEKNKERMNLKGETEIDSELFNTIKDELNIDINDTQKFIDKLKDDISDDKHDISMNRMKGGSKDLYNLEKNEAMNVCESIKKNNNIYLHQLPYLNNC